MVQRPVFRLLETDIMSAADNFAWDQTLIDAVSDGTSGPTIRFLRFEPSVLIGRYQTVAQETREPYCREHGLAINRRLTGGGAILFEPSQLGWEIIIPRDVLPVPRGITSRFEYFCRGCVAGLRKLGLAARFRPVNDIEVDGRKISGTGGLEEGNALFFQGTLLMDFDAEKMVRALRIPIEKLQDKEIESIKDRVTWVGKELGTVPDMAAVKHALAGGFEKAYGIHCEAGAFTAEERQRFAELRRRYVGEAWIHAVRRSADDKDYLSAAYKAPGGIVRTQLFTDRRGGMISQAFITGDFFADPPGAVYELEARLKNHPVHRDRIRETVTAFFGDYPDALAGVSAVDMAAALLAAAGKCAFLPFGFTLAEADGLATVVTGPERVFTSCKPYLLLPYCSKNTGCGMRYEKQCRNGCTACTVGEAAADGTTAGIGSETVTSFEDLMITLERIKNEGYDAFIGCCCAAFLTKHRDDFEKAGVPGILIDIDSDTCYDLGIQQDAYAGKFENQTEVRTGLLKKVLDVFAVRRDADAPV